MRGRRSGVFCHVCGFPVTTLMPFGFEHRKQRPAAVLLVVSDQTRGGPTLAPPRGGGGVPESRLSICTTDEPSLGEP